MFRTGQAQKLLDILARATRNQMVESADPSRSLFTSLVDSHFLISNFHF